MELLGIFIHIVDRNTHEEHFCLTFIKCIFNHQVRTRLCYMLSSSSLGYMKYSTTSDTDTQFYDAVSLSSNVFSIFETHRPIP